MASICKALLAEVIESKRTLKNSRDLSHNELSWMSQFPTKATTYSNTNDQTEKWEIRLDEQAFLKWCSSLNESCLFFDGASKGNPG